MYKRQINNNEDKYKEYPDEEKIYMIDSLQDTMMHTNKFTDEYLDYVNNIDPEICKSMSYSRLVNLNICLLYTSDIYTLKYTFYIVITVVAFSRYVK